MGRRWERLCWSLRRTEAFPRVFFWVVLHHFGCCAVLCTSAPAEKSGLEAVRSNLKGKWLFLEFHREEADIGSLKQATWRDIMYCLEKRVVGRSINPPCANGSWGGKMMSKREDTRCRFSHHLWLCSRGQGSLSRLGSRHHWGWRTCYSAQTDVCLCKDERALGEGTGSAAPWAPALFLCDLYAHTCVWAHSLTYVLVPP